MMNGLGSPPPAAQPPAQQPGAPMQQPGAPAQQQQPLADGPDGEVSPEEQAQYDAFVKGALAVIYPEATPGEVNPAILDNLRGKFDPNALELFQQTEPALTDSPQDSVAASAVLLTVMGEQKGGQELTDDVVMHGGTAIIEELIEVAEAAKIHDFDEKEIEGVTYRAFDLYRTASQRVDPEALTQQFQELMAANEKGELGRVLPGLPGGDPMTQQTKEA